MALAMAASGYGIALARAPTTDDLVGRLGLEPLKIVAGLKSSEAYHLVYQNVDSLSAAAAAFREWLIDEAR
jgi:DNA-binding transcriptional LysR family regulator